MSTIRSTKRIIGCLQVEENAITPSVLHKKTKVSYDSTLQILDFLEDQDLVESVTDGRIRLFKIKKYEKKGERDEYDRRCKNKID